jgi:hypothetical protein
LTVRRQITVRSGFHPDADDQIPSGSVVRVTILLGAGEDESWRQPGLDRFVAAPITSRLGVAQFDLALLDWRSAGLNVPSTVRLHKVAVLSNAARIPWP